jgi:hypothetical protein
VAKEYPKYLKSTVPLHTAIVLHRRDGQPSKRTKGSEDVASLDTILQLTEQEFHRLVAQERVRRVAQIQEIIDRSCTKEGESTERAVS